MPEFSDQDRRPPRCPNCGQKMRLDRTQRPLGGLPELKTYRCFFCREVLIEAVEDE